MTQKLSVLPALLSPAKAIEQMVSDKAEYAAVRLKTKSVLIDLSSLRRAMDADRVTETSIAQLLTKSPNEVTSLCVAGGNSAELNHAEWKQVAKGLDRTSAPGVVFNWGTDEPTFLTKGAVELLAFSRGTSSTVKEMALLQFRLYRCDQCIPPSFEMPAGGDAPVCPSDIGHGAMTPA